jgi:hypothetical protein
MSETLPARPKSSARFWWIYGTLAAVSCVLLCAGVTTVGVQEYRDFQHQGQSALKRQPTIVREVGNVEQIRFDWFRSLEAEGDETLVFHLQGAHGKAIAVVALATLEDGSMEITEGYLEMPDGRIVPLFDEAGSSADGTVRWIDFQPGPATEAEIAAAEAEIGVSLPEDYRRYLATRQGRAPKQEGSVYIPGPDYWNPVECLHWPAADPENPYGLSRERDFVPEGFLLIGEDGYGNYYCLGITEPNRNQVVFVDHSLAGDGHVVHLADSFQEFLLKVK